jgi:hypothetical protein
VPCCARWEKRCLSPELLGKLLLCWVLFCGREAEQARVFEVAYRLCSESNADGPAGATSSVSDLSIDQSSEPMRTE